MGISLGSVCPEREALRREATTALREVIELTKGQIEALKMNDQSELMALDKKLETTFGLKERSFGALRQHCKDHGC